VKLVKNVWFEVGGDRLAFYVQAKKARDRAVRLPGRMNLKDWGLKMESEMADGKSKAQDWSHTDKNVAFLDWAKLKPPFVLRSRRRGDRFRPLGMKGTKSVADFLIDAKVPRHLRDDLPVLTSNGKIVWLVGQRISDQFKVTKNTKDVLKLEVKSSNLP
jgi:tRNA(Ile)-lysidine synthase